jgi:hypothetical protein
MDLRGCLKPTCLGCLGLLVILVIVIGITAAIAWRGAKDQRLESRELAAAEAVPTGGFISGPGRVILDLAQGEFYIRAAAPGEGLHVKARFDQETNELVDDLRIEPDSTWVYRVSYHRTIPALQAILQAIFSEHTESRVEVYLPPDLPIALEMHIKQGGCETDLGGLWLTEADIHFGQGGFELDVSEPLHEPVARLSVVGRMGGFDTRRLGNASPRTVIIDCRMGGASIDLRGEWLQDSDISARVSMGGMAIMVPDDVEVRGVDVQGRLRRRDREVPLPVLTISARAKMGEVEVIQR